MMRLLVGALLVLLSAAGAKAESDIELLNATLVAKFHFAEEAPDGQMVGAYQVSFRNNGDTPTNRISLLLNPGLKVEQVIGANGARLKTTSSIIPVAGFDLLELTQVEVTLPRPVIKNKPRQEIVVHYRGFLQDLSQTGLAGVKETLHPDFTMIRAQSFGYPVFATTDQRSIQKAWGHKPFYQVAFLDVPGLNTVVGNLQIARKTTDGDVTKFEMKSDRPTSLMTLAIGDYRIEDQELISTAKLPEGGNWNSEVIRQAAVQADKIKELFGHPLNREKLLIMGLPNGFGSEAQPGLLFMGTYAPKIFRDPAKTFQTRALHHNEPNIAFAAVWDLWRFSGTGQPGHWANGLDGTVLWKVAQNIGLKPQDTHLAELSFMSLKQALSEAPLLGKTALKDYMLEGLDGKIALSSSLALDVLYDLLGRDDFFALVRGMRADLSVGYVDMQTVADYLDQHIKNRKARKFAENWFSRGRIGKDMAKASSFEELVALYK